MYYAAADHGLKWSDLASDYITENDVFPDGRDRDWDTYESVTMAVSTNNRYWKVYFHCEPGSGTIRKVRVRCYATIASAVKVYVVDASGGSDVKISNEEWVPDSVATDLTLTLTSRAAPSDDLRICYEATGSTTLYTYEQGFIRAVRGGGIIVV